VVGELNEKVELNFLETTKLTEGKIMLYRANKDIHSQSHPDEFSISLNLLSSHPEQGFTDQFCFDLNSGRISSLVGTTNMTRIMLCKLAKYVGDSKSVNLLESIAVKHPSPRIRSEAFSSLAALESSDSDRIWNMALSDRSLFVKNKAESVINSLK